MAVQEHQASSGTCIPTLVAAGKVLRVLVVEDNPVHARMIERWLENVRGLAGTQYMVRVAGSIAAVRQLLAHEQFDAIVLDLVLPDCPREETLQQIRALSSAPVVVLSSVQEEGVALNLLREGAQDYLVKGQVDPDRLQRSIRYAVQRHQLEEELRRQNQALRALSECNYVVGHAESEAELYAEVCKVVVRRAGYRFAWIGLVRHGVPPRVEPCAWDGFAPSYLEKISITLDDAPTGKGPAARAVRYGRPQGVQDVLTDPDFEPWRDRAVAHGYRSLVAVPICVQDQNIGVLCVYSEHVNAFDAKAAELIEELGTNLAVGVDRIRAEQERRRAEAERRLAESRFRLLAEVSPIGVAYGLADGGCVYLNDRACQLLGRPRHELLGHGWKRFIYEEDRPRLVEEWRVWETAPFESTEFRFVQQTGAVIWVNLQLAAVRSAEGSGLAVVATITDVTARRRAEEAVEKLTRDLERLVAERTRQLEHALRELEAFNHSLAHDIRAPLRRMIAYCELLKLRCGEHVPEQARHYVNLVRSNAAHLDRLVEDLVNLARVRTHRLEYREVDVSKVCTQVLRTLEEAEPERRVDWRVEPGLRACADPYLLEVALSNLLENAWKYTRGREVARIEVGGMNVDGNVTFYVRDNGCGFDPSFAEQIFTPFTRLHRADEFEGTGIGLATVQRIIARHNGRVWAESTPGEGATFYLLLPPGPGRNG